MLKVEGRGKRGGGGVSGETKKKRGKKGEGDSNAKRTAEAKKKLDRGPPVKSVNKVKSRKSVAEGSGRLFGDGLVHAGRSPATSKKVFIADDHGTDTQVCRINLTCVTPAPSEEEETIPEESVSVSASCSEDVEPIQLEAADQIPQAEAKQQSVEPALLVATVKNELSEYYRLHEEYLKQLSFLTSFKTEKEDTQSLKSQEPIDEVNVSSTPLAAQEAIVEVTRVNNSCFVPELSFHVASCNIPEPEPVKLSSNNSVEVMMTEEINQSFKNNHVDNLLNVNVIGEKSDSELIDAANSAPKTNESVYNRSLCQPDFMNNLSAMDGRGRCNCGLSEMGQLSSPLHVEREEIKLDSFIKFEELSVSNDTSNEGDNIDLIQEETDCDMEVTEFKDEFGNVCTAKTLFDRPCEQAHMLGTISTEFNHNNLRDKRDFSFQADDDQEIAECIKTEILNKVLCESFELLKDEKSSNKKKINVGHEKRKSNDSKKNKTIENSKHKDQRNYRSKKIVSIASEFDDDPEAVETLKVEISKKVKVVEPKGGKTRVREPMFWEGSSVPRSIPRSSRGSSTITNSEVETCSSLGKREPSISPRENGSQLAYGSEMGDNCGGGDTPGSSSGWSDQRLVLELRAKLEDKAMQDYESAKSSEADASSLDSSTGAVSSTAQTEPLDDSEDLPPVKRSSAWFLPSRDMVLDAVFSVMTGCVLYYLIDFNVRHFFLGASDDNVV